MLDSYSAVREADTFNQPQLEENWEALSEGTKYRCLQALAAPHHIGAILRSMSPNERAELDGLMNGLSERQVAAIERALKVRPGTLERFYG